MQRGVELYGTDHGNLRPGLEVALNSGKQMRDIDADIDEDIESLDLSDADRDQTAVRIVDEQIAAKRSRGIIIYAASAVCDITHDESADSMTKASQDVGYGGREEQQTFREL